MYPLRIGDQNVHIRLESFPIRNGSRMLQKRLLLSTDFIILTAATDLETTEEPYNLLLTADWLPTNQKDFSIILNYPRLLVLFNLEPTLNDLS